MVEEIFLTLVAIKNYQFKCNWTISLGLLAPQ